VSWYGNEQDSTGEAFRSRVLGGPLPLLRTPPCRGARPPHHLAAQDPDLARDSPPRCLPVAEGRAVREEPCRRHDAGATAEDALGAADVPPAGAEHARPRPA